MQLNINAHSLQHSAKALSASSSQKATHVLSCSIVFCGEGVMVLSAQVREDDRKRTGRDEEMAQGGQEVCWPVVKTVPHSGTIFSVIWSEAPTGLPPLYQDLQMTTVYKRQQDKPSDLSWKLNEAGRLCAVLCV